MLPLETLGKEDAAHFDDDDGSSSAAVDRVYRLVLAVFVRLVVNAVVDADDDEAAVG